MSILMNYLSTIHIEVQSHKNKLVVVHCCYLKPRIILFLKWHYIPGQVLQMLNCYLYINGSDGDHPNFTYRNLVLAFLKGPMLKYVWFKIDLIDINMMQYCKEKYEYSQHMK